MLPFDFLNSFMFTASVSLRKLINAQCFPAPQDVKNNEGIMKLSNSKSNNQCEILALLTQVLLASRINLSPCAKYFRVRGT